MITAILAVASDASSTGSTASPWLDIAQTWVTYIGVLATAIIVAVAGVRKALKDLKEGTATGDSRERSRIAAATLVETATMAEWTASNKEAADTVRDLTDKLDGVCRAINYNTEAVRDANREAGELRHQVERLRDKMP